MDDHNSFNIQRRNLIIINCILLILSFTNYNVSELSLIGLKFNLDKNISLHTMIIIIWSYIVIRYLSTFLFMIKNNEIKFKDNISFDWNQELRIHIPIKNELLARLSIPFILLVVGCIKIFEAFALYVLNKNFHDYIIPILFSILTFSVFTVNNIKIIGNETYQNMVSFLFIISLSATVYFMKINFHKGDLIKKTKYIDRYKEKKSLRKRR